MNPGEIVTCPRCRVASLPLHTTGGRWPEQGESALLVTWTQGPYPRHDTASVHAWRGVCLWCSDEIPPGSFAEGRTSLALPASKDGEGLLTAQPAPGAGRPRLQADSKGPLDRFERGTQLGLLL